MIETTKDFYIQIQKNLLRARSLMETTGDQPPVGIIILENLRVREKK
jgi:hypothetical protein